MKQTIALFTFTILCTIANAQQLRFSGSTDQRAAPVKYQLPSGIITNESWYETSDAFVIKFLADEVSYRLIFDKKATWLNTIRTYYENRLPRDIRHMVRSLYYDDRIILVEEILRPGDSSIYIIHLEGENHFVNLRLYRGELDVLKEFQKSTGSANN